MFYIIGGLMSSKIVKKFGRKITISLASLPAGIFIALYTLIPNLWLSIIFALFGCFLAELCQQRLVV